MIPSLMIFQLSFKALQMLNIIKWRICIEEECHACHWGRTFMPCVWWCVVVCGTCWFCIWSGVSVSYDWGPHLVRKVSHWHDASFLLEFLFCFFVFFSLFARGLCTNNQKFKGEVLHNLPKALITIEEHM